MLTTVPVNATFLEGACVVGPVTTPVNLDEVRRYLGYPKNVVCNPRVQEILGRWVATASALAEARAVYEVFPVAEIDRRHVRIRTPGGDVTFHGAIGEFLGAVRWLAVFVATAGPEVERLAAGRMLAGDRLAGLVVNAVGAERAEAAAALVQADLAARAASAGLVLTLPYSPGYCGMAITEQRTLFAAVDPSPVGVRLSPDCMMVPLKSVSGLIGLGEAGVIAPHYSPCERCSHHNCAMRR